MNQTIEQQALRSRYERAQTLEQGIFSKRVAFNTTVFPHWIGESACFWYVRDTKIGEGASAVFGKDYRIVNAKTGSNEAAFNHQALAQTLAETVDKEVDANNLPLSHLTFDTDLNQFRFTAFGKCWQMKRDGSSTATPSYPADWKVSPDGKHALIGRDNNLWLRDLDTGKERALTEDGEAFYVYGQPTTVYGRQEAGGIDALWSPDSQQIFTQVIDTRHLPTGVPLVQHVPTDGSMRPNILNPERRVALPQDEAIEAYQFLAIDIKSGRRQSADYSPCPVCYPPYWGYFTSGRGWWDADNRHAYFMDQVRGGQRAYLVKFDTHTGTTERLIEESSDSCVTLIPVTHTIAFSLPLTETDELIWFSERSGWGHLYLYDMSNGRLKNPITSGDWVVRSVLHIDIERRELWIQTAGRAKGRNPYYCDICRVNMDTGELTEVLATDHEYTVCDRRSRVATADTSAQGVSSCGDYAVVTRSRVDERPVSLLLDRDGKILQTLETADISGLVENWQWPEPVITRADDGTDIYGVVFRPSDFDAKKSYPVLDCTYYYSAPVGSFTNNFAGDRHYLSPAAYAELGFIVVMFNNRGNEGLRNTAFAAYQDPVFPLPHSCMLKYNKSDCVAGIQQLAERYPYMDLKRVGVAGTSSVPAPVLAMLAYPDFYKVGVSQNQMLDLRLMSAVGMSQDLATCPQLEDLAENLQGKLLLIAGMMDDVLPVSMTFRLVEALQKANKRFDMLILPNLDHTAPGYPLQRSWDYFVEHLLGLEPPEDFKLVNGIDLMMAELT